MRMKRLFFCLALAALTFSSCEKVIDVDLDTAAPRLVIDAALEWQKGTDGSEQHIRLTTTAGYYDETIPTVSDAIVEVTAGSGATFSFTEENPGDYVCRNFVPVLNETYTLSVTSGGDTYTATETLFPVPDIGEVEQENDGGFLGDEIEVRFFYQDDPNTLNYYVARFDTEVIPYPDFYSYSDEFFQGNRTFEFFSDEDLKAGDVVHFRLAGVSRRCQEYIQKLVTIAGNNQGPFGTPPATVRGNLVNTTEPEKYALGYFRVSEVDSASYTVQ